MCPCSSLTNSRLQWAWFSKGGGRMSPREIDLSPEWSLVNLAMPRGMSTKPSRGLTHHWMGLSSEDNWLSIRDGDNKVRVSRKAVNHTCLSGGFVFIPFTLSLYFTVAHGSFGISLLFFFHLFCPEPSCWWYLLYVQQRFRTPSQPFRQAISPFAAQTTE